MYFDRVTLLLALTNLAYAKQPSAPSSVKAPLRQLPWGQLNFLHTTDTHGWHAGHLQEPQYSADWGDYISFAAHLRKRADADGSDVLLIDTGDRVEGNGLYDASKPPGKYTFDIFKHQQIDVITPGNHELYINTTSQREFDVVVPDFKNSYIASNVDIHSDKDDGKLVPLAPRYRKFKTKNQGLQILAFGFLFDFKGNANNTVVQSVEDTVEEQWFQDAIREKDVDLFLVAGHVPVRDSMEFETIYKAIRNVEWDTPIVFFGGHTHIRDFRKWENKAQGIESGRYMETVGFLSMSGLQLSKKKEALGVDASAAKLEYNRLYLDNNLYSFHQHSGTNKSTFDTDLGLNVSASIRSARKELDLDETFGCAPRDFWLNRAPYPSKDSLLTLLDRKVLPDTFTTDDSKENPSIIITNTGAMRFDIFGGKVTEDSIYLLSPFLSGFRKITNVPYEAAGKVLKILNNEGAIPLRDLLMLFKGQPGFRDARLDDLIPALPPARETRMSTDGIREYFLDEFVAQASQQTPLGNKDEDSDKDEPQIPGYTTKDDLGGDGDDTIHQAIKFYSVPNCVGSEIGFSSADDDTPESVDLVYNEFIQNWILLALEFLGVKYGEENTRVALEGQTMTGVIKDWVEENWKCKDEE